MSTGKSYHWWQQDAIQYIHLVSTLTILDTFHRAHPPLCLPHALPRQSSVSWNPLAYPSLVPVQLYWVEAILWATPSHLCLEKRMLLLPSVTVNPETSRILYLRSFTGSMTVADVFAASGQICWYCCVCNWKRRVCKRLMDQAWSGHYWCRYQLCSW